MAGITWVKPSPGLMLMAGISRLHILAATITPPVKPSMPSMAFRWMFLNKKTKEAPAAVTSQVKRVAYSAARTGEIVSK